jgi:hypothetical protein
MRVVFVLRQRNEMAGQLDENEGSGKEAHVLLVTAQDIAAAKKPI